MKTKQEKQEQAKVRQAEYDKLTPKQKLLKIDIRFGDSKGAIKERYKVADTIKHQIATGAIVNGVGDSIQKPEKKPYQKPKRS